MCIFISIMFSRDKLLSVADIVTKSLSFELLQADVSGGIKIAPKVNHASTLPPMATKLLER